MSQKKQSYSKSNVLHPVEVTWIDSMSTIGWGTAHEEANMECTSVGYLLRSRKDRVAIVQNHGPYSIGEIIEIPKVAVKRIRRLT